MRAALYYRVSTPGQVEAFSAALRRLMEPRERAKYEGVGRSATVARYDVSRLVADVEALYDELTSART